MNYLCRLLFLCMLAIFFNVSPAMSEGDIRALNFNSTEPSTEGAAKRKDATHNRTNLSLKTTIDLERNSEKSLVSKDYHFKSGDRVRFLYNVNTDGYICWRLKTSANKYDVLFPTKKTGMNNKVRRNKQYTIPVKGYFTFDNNTCTEEIQVILYKEKTAATCGSDGNVVESKVSQDRTRGLVFEEKHDSVSGVSTISRIAPDNSIPLVFNFNLIHK